MRLRLFVILIGALLVAATFTFPVWWPQVRPVEADLRFPGLADNLQNDYIALSERERALYLEMNASNSARAVAVLTARLEGDAPLSPEEQQPPELDSSVVTLVSGEFETLPVDDLFENGLIDIEDVSPWRDLFRAEGTFTIYEFPDARKLLWLEAFAVTHGPGLRIGLSTLEYPLSYDQIEQTVLDLGPLRGSIGNQRYNIPSDENIGIYNSIVVFDPMQRLLYGVALF